MPSRLTFGVELEFALALLEDGQDDPEPNLPQPITVLPRRSNGRRFKWKGPLPVSKILKDAVFDLVATKLVAAGLPTRGIIQSVSDDGSDENSSSPECFQDDGVGWIPSHRHRRYLMHQQPIEDTNKQSEDLVDLTSAALWTTSSQDEFGNQWMVTEDPTVQSTRPQDYYWFSMEVQSPPYIFCEDALQAVKLACRTLTSEFRVETNTSTGLHVHAAEGADGYAFQTVKKLMAFLWTFEPQIDQLHPNRRASDEEKTWYESLRRGSQLSRGAFTNPKIQLTVVQGLKHIYAADNLAALHDMMRADAWKSAYYMGHIESEYDDSIKKTIEFRQHEGSMNGTRITEWIKTVITLIEWTTDVEAIPLMDFLMDAAEFEDRCWPAEQKPAYDIVDLLNDIGLVDRAAYWDQAIPKGKKKDPTQYYKRPRDPAQNIGERVIVDLTDSP
jgi:hypothetical protein